MNCNWLHNIFFQKDAANINNFLIGTAKNDINVIFIFNLLINNIINRVLILLYSVIVTFIKKICI